MQGIYYKIGLLILSEDRKKFLVCEKYEGDITSQYIMPGGKFEEDNDIDCLNNEIKEELDCDLNLASLVLVGAYTDNAAGDPEKLVTIKLYQGTVVGEPAPHSEIKKLHWISSSDKNNEKVSAIIRNKIIPDLLEKEILLKY